MAGPIKIVAVVRGDELAARVRDELGGQYALLVVPTVEEAAAQLRVIPDVEVAVLCERDPGSGVGDDAGIRAAGDLRAIRPGLPVVVVTPTPESRDATAAIQARQITSAVQRRWRRGELAAAVDRAHELGRLGRELESMRARTQRRFDISTAMNTLSSQIADLSDYAGLARVLAGGPLPIVRASVGAALLASDGAPALLHIHCRLPCDERDLGAVQDRCLSLFRSLTGRALEESQLAVDISGERLGVVDETPAAFTHVPIRADSQLIGILLLRIDPDQPLSTDDEKLLYFVANRAGDTIRRLSRRRSSERRRLALMLESMADGLLVTDRSSDRVLINRAARQMLGIPDDVEVTTAYLKDNLGFYPFDLIATRTPGSVRQPLREELSIAGKALHSTVTPVYDDKRGALAGVVVVLRDISLAKEQDRKQSEFVSRMSHELRTPLMSITGAVDIVLSGFAGAVSEKQHRYLAMARDSCNQLTHLVDDLFDVVRYDSGEVELHFTPLFIDELGRDVAARFADGARDKGIVLDVRTEVRGIRIVGDPDRLTQVMTNLLSNAVKFTQPGGRIEVEVFGPSVASDMVGVSVYNTGTPIPREDRERIFAKFEQLEDSSTRRTGGTGLGLAISRAIVERHGGRIWVEALPDGTKFVFTVPVAPEADDAADEAAGEPELSVRLSTVKDTPGTVLIVDPDRRSSLILKGILMSSGHEVLSARDRDEAIHLARERRPGLAVINASMQDADNVALVEIFRHDPDTRKTATLVVGAGADRELALAAGATEFLEAPIQPGRLLELCNQLLADAGRARAYRVLVVDDDRAIRAICREVLENSGYEVLDVGDARTALAEAKRFRPDLLLLDIMMPEMDGFRTAELMRADPATSMTPIIFVSAKGETNDKVRAFRTGAEDYLVKPFDAAELVARVRKAVERQARELGASPTTQLPGAGEIEYEIERRLGAAGNDAFCYLDLDNLKAFNDYYGYAKADGIIRQTGDLIRDIVARKGRPGDFIGHIAGDDFVFITSADRAADVCTTICHTFDRLIPLYYNKVDRERGYIEAEDRYGVVRQFPIMSASVAVVTVGDRAIRTFSDLATAAARAKKMAKELDGSSCVIDGQVIVGQPPREAARH